MATRRPIDDPPGDVASLRAELAELREEQARRRQAEQALQSLLAGTSGVVGEDFFRALARHLSSALQVRYVYVTKLAEEMPLRFRTLAACENGGLGEDFDYDALRTPCAIVAERGAYFCAGSVQREFPDDDWLQKIGAFSYLGVRIDNSLGKPLGHVCVLDDKPLPSQEPALSIMRMFAVRAASELERLQAEKQQTVMIAELNHRVKNNLATVLAIADQTLQASPSLAAFGHAFMGRVRSMAIVHEMLAQAVWTGAELSKLIQRLSEPYRDDRPERIIRAGEPVVLSADLAPALCMVLHELMTNAAKYGALSVADGSVAVCWSIDTGGTTPRLLLSWREHDGPPVAPPTHRGVGSGLIERMIPYQLHGRVDLAFEPDGVRCEIGVPLQAGVSARGFR